jgi:Flp pilus assembly pilin Flp
MVALFNRLLVLRREDGQTMAEYGVLLALIAVVAIAGILLVGQDVLAAFNSIAGAL